MRIASNRPASDLTARARILDAAIVVFAEQGSTASVRAIAAAAGVSPALITHHFGSKETLKAECDERVLDAYTDVKLAGIANPMATMSILDESDAVQAEHIAVASSYMLRAFLDGGATAQHFYQRLLERIAEIMAVAAASGMVRPDCADDAHVRYLSASMLGFMLVQFVIDPPATPT
ncbi:MAG: TetR family transcriptional regulator, partial [Propionibacteriaceae bacterium]|nr:TetR family transcriptional regulator [Propionibacteriaceae bacterium]